MTLETAFDVARTLTAPNRERVVNYISVVYQEEEAERPAVDAAKRIGAAKGRFRAPEDFDANHEEVYRMLMRSALCDY